MQRNPLSLITALLIALGGCAPLPQVEPGSLLLDTQKQLLCLNNEAQCLSLSLVVANQNRDLILQHWPVDRFDWSLLDTSSELATLLLNPPENSYQVTPIEPNRYRISTHPVSLEIWDVLYREQKLRYLEEDSSDL